VFAVNAKLCIRTCQSAGPQNTLSPTQQNMLEINAVCKCSFYGMNGLWKSGWRKGEKISQKYTANTMMILNSRPMVLFN
jgi:hypothetical protein